MEHTKQKNLDAAVAGLRQRFGPHVVHTLRDAEAVVALPTGFARLDRALGIGGIPRGHITELIGTSTSGVHTLASRLITNAQQTGDMAVFLDLSQTFDPDYAVRCGVNLANLLLARPKGSDEALDMAYTFTIERGAGVIVFDESLLKATTKISFTPLLHTLAESGCALLRLATWGSQSATVRLHLTRERWLSQRRDISGYRARVRILKNKFASAAEDVCLTIGFHGVVNGDGT